MYVHDYKFCILTITFFIYYIFIGTDHQRGGALTIKDQIYSQVLQDIAHLLPLTLVCLRVLPAETNTKVMCVCTRLQILHSHHHILYFTRY